MTHRHAEADTRPVSIERSDAIDAAAGLALMAREYRRTAKLRRHSGPWLREAAQIYESASARVQRAADEVM